MLKLSSEDKAPQTWKFRHLPLNAKGAKVNHCDLWSICLQCAFSHGATQLHTLARKMPGWLYDIFCLISCLSLPWMPKTLSTAIHRRPHPVIDWCMFSGTKIKGPARIRVSSQWRGGNCKLVRFIWPWKRRKLKGYAAKWPCAKRSGCAALCSRCRAHYGQQTAAAVFQPLLV